MGFDVYGKRFDREYEADSKLCDDIGVQAWVKLPLEERPWNQTWPGAYFQTSNWGWRPIAEFVEEHFPDIYRHCEHWHSNDGDGLEAFHAEQLADGIDAMIADGRAADAIELRHAKLRALPDKSCWLCHGSGVRRDGIAMRTGRYREKPQPEVVIPEDAMDVDERKPHPRRGQTGWCNGCDGRGYRRPSACDYELTIEELKRFSEFCRHSGGFTIC